MNYPHSSNLSTSIPTSSYATQSNLEALISRARASPTYSSRRKSSSSHHPPPEVEHPRGIRASRPPVGEDTALLLDEEDESREDAEADDEMDGPLLGTIDLTAAAPREDPRVPSLQGSRLSQTRRASTRRSFSRRSDSPNASPLLSAISVPRSKKAPSIDPSRSRSRSRSISRTRLAAGKVSGFSNADNVAAVETIVGIRVPLLRSSGSGGVHMKDDPAEELDPVLDLDCPGDEEGNVVETWKSSYAAELPILIRSAFPIFLSQLAEYSLVLSSVISVGHLGTLELAASSLASMTASVSAYAIIQGMVSALDSLLPAAWTSESKMVGVWTQRMMVVVSVTLVPMYFVWFNAEGILLLLRQEPVVAAKAAQYLRYLSIGLPAYAVNNVMKKYFQSQGLVNVPTIVIAIVAPLNAMLNYTLVWGPDALRLGFRGAPLSTAISQNVAGALMIGHAAFIAPKTAWGGFTKDAFSKLGTVTSLGLAGTVMISSEWYIWELCALAASILGPVPLAVQSILLSCASVLYQVPASLGIATAVRVGNLLGASREFEAKNAARLAILVCMFLSMFNSLLLIVFRNHIALIFNEDPEVVVLVGQVAIYVALFQVADGLAGTCGGILRAVGKQSAGALINLTAYYVLGAPLGIWLAFNLDLGLVGLWLGLTFSLFYAAAASVWIIFRINWPHAVDKARERLGLAVLSEEDKRNGRSTYGTMHV